jgi:multicomponent Na+:H+ antiporter subunit A
MWLLLLAHLVAGLGLVAGAERVGRAAFIVGAVPMVAAVGYAGARSPGVLDGRAVSESSTWVGSLNLTVDLRLDGFGLLMVLIVSGIGVAVMTYGASYFSPTPRSARIAGLLVLFSGSMLGLVLADNVLFLYVCWELTSITSWLLIASDHTNPSARGGAQHALLVTGAGGLALLGGLVVVAQAAGTYSLSGILAEPPAGGSVGVGLALVLVGVFTKSAQFPTHAWLPGAMVAPTPVSAYLHSATMVKAGIYLAARLAPVFAVVGAWRPAVTVIGLATMLIGGLRALRQHDLKLLLAMGTISQLGFMLVLVGTGRPDATIAGCVLLLAHALFKAALFLVVGIVDHQAGTRDRRKLDGFGAGWGTVKLITFVSAASMAGLPPLLGFVAKEAAFEAFIDAGVGGAVTLAGLVVGSALTVAYSVRFAATVLAPARSNPGDRVAVAPAAVGAATVDATVGAVATMPRRAAGPPPPDWAFTAPAAILAGLTLVTGVGVSTLVSPLVDAAAQALDARVDHVHLTLWHGFTWALLLSVITYALGAAVVAARRTVARLQVVLSPDVGADDAYTAAIHGLNVAARRLTGVVQSGSLPVYSTVILLTAVAAPGAMLAMEGGWSGWPRWSETPAQVLVAAGIVCAAVAAAAASRRFAAVLLLGAVGYGMAVLFVVQGAPDLALTQFGVETLSIAVFMLVLRHLPDRFVQRSRTVGSWFRGLVAGAVAVGVFWFALIAGGARVAPPISSEIAERSLPEAEGRNVVNVVLVDVRGLDTLGEISVLTVAAVGVVALARVGRRSAAREVDE